MRMFQFQKEPEIALISFRLRSIAAPVSRAVLLSDDAKMHT